MQLTTKRSTTLLTVILVTLLILLPVTFRETPLAQGTSVPLTVRMTRVIELDCDEGFGEDCPNDYFSKAEIDGQGLQESNCCAHPGGDPRRLAVRAEVGWIPGDRGTRPLEGRSSDSIPISLESSSVT